MTETPLGGWQRGMEAIVKRYVGIHKDGVILGKVSEGVLLDL